MVTGLTVLEKILIRIKSSIKNKNDMEEINEIVKLMAVSLYYDKKVTEHEFDMAKNIVDNIFDTDTQFVANLIRGKIETYINEFWTFKKDADFILGKILIEGNWLYAEYMVDIFKADGVSQEENDTLLKLSSLVDARKILLKDLGLI